VEREFDGEIIDNREFGFAHERLCPGRRPFPLVQRRRNVLGREWIAVVERNVIAKVERPRGAVVFGLPCFRESKLRYQRSVVCNEGLEDMAIDLSHNGGGADVWMKRWNSRRYRESIFTSAHLPRRRTAGAQRECGEQGEGRGASGGGA